MSVCRLVESYGHCVRVVCEMYIHSIYAVYALYILSELETKSFMLILRPGAMYNAPRFRCHCGGYVSFFKPSYVGRQWRITLRDHIRVQYHALNDEPVREAFRRMGGELECPVHIDTLGRYLRALRRRVAGGGAREMTAMRFAGPWEADETFVRCKRKYNRGRAVKRHHSLVQVHAPSFFVLSLRCWVYMIVLGTS